MNASRIPFPLYLPSAATAAALTGAFLLLAACGEASDPPPRDADPVAEVETRNSIVDVARTAGQFSTLLRAVEAAGLTQTLQEEGPFTVFAPTDGAFSALSGETMDALLDDPDALADILLYHVVSGEYTLQDLRDVSELETVQGRLLAIVDGPRGLTIQGSNTLTTDVRADNGIIHVITEVLVPESD